MPSHLLNTDMHVCTVHVHVIVQKSMTDFSLVLFVFQLTAEEHARTEVEARLSATNEMYKEAAATYEADRAQKEEEIRKLQEEVMFWASKSVQLIWCMHVHVHVPFDSLAVGTFTLPSYEMYMCRLMIPCMNLPVGHSPSSVA